VIDGWPGRGDTVLWTGGQQPVPLRVADAYVVEAGAFAFLVATPQGLTDRGRTTYAGVR
jgi:hypothetical protein